ncbi:hypothetical protein GCM10023184_37150 [Flaviaesturariibacter amylovorans]|uniref:DUF4145 domain-containing protein n=1 Tax=Flaviaesturariibacter amylovorans TaxID=1084520 RepID=A0ABP8HII0_9BACT
MLYVKPVKSSIAEDDEELSVQDEYMTLQCMGCDHVSFLVRHGFPQTNDDAEERDYYDVSYPETKYFAHIRLLDGEERMALPRLLDDLYAQLEIAFQHEACTLAGIGLRLMVEAICLHQKVPGSTLKAKIDSLHSEGLISKNDLPILHNLRELGNISAHEIKGFPIDMLTHALEIVNHILKGIFIMPKINRKLKLGKKKAPAKGNKSTL